MDDKLYPVRGQTVLVRNDPGPMIAAAKTSDGEDEVTYVMTRAAGEFLSLYVFIRCSSS